ncbi:MAG TPA: A/G-specific adenine glycosylase, partial [Methylophaga sp.]|nr:A/G-specific adenine glycosylase [Methylophaga sp.]
SFPEGKTAEAPDNRLPIKNTLLESSLPEIKHVFSHFKLTITPYLFTAEPIHLVAENNRHIWVKIDQALTLGLPAPVKQLIQFLSSTERML